MQKKVLVLGGSDQQRPLFEIAREKGHAAFLADYTAAPACAPLAQKVFKTSTFDEEGVLKIVRDESIDLIMTSGTDQPVMIAASVSERCGLPYPISAEQGVMVTNKEHMRRCLEGAGIRTPRTRVLRRGDRLLRDAFAGACVVKPADSQGQRGITRLSDGGREPGFAAAVEKAWQHSRSGVAVVEEFVAGDEVTLNGWISRGDLRFSMVTDRLHFDDTQVLGICKQHRFPSRFARERPRMAALRETAARIARAFGIRNGPLYIQMIVDSDLSPSVIEFGHRVGGGYEGFLIPLMNGFDIIRAYYELVDGDDADLRPPVVTGYGSVAFLFGFPGTIATVRQSSAFRHQGAFRLGAGDEIPRLQDATSRLGYFLAAGDTPAHYAEQFDLILQGLQVDDPEGRDLILRDIYG
jgi:phosphoribosylamine-glycine ligase